jgi:hypothetical protein
VKPAVRNNLLTLVMSIVLATVTWAYLFAQGVGTEELVVEFAPAPLDPDLFASVVYRDGDNQILQPGGTFKIRVTGPKGDVRSQALRPPKTFRCELKVDPKDLAESRGTFTLALDRNHFTVTGDIQVAPVLPSTRIAVHYVRYVERTLELAVSRFDYEGRPRAGYRVESISSSVPRVKCRVPADRAEELRQIRLRPVPVEEKQETFAIEWEISAADKQQNVRPLEPFRVEVRIVRDVVPRRITVDLALAGRPEVLRKVELETKSIVLELLGPEDLVNDAPETAFAPYVVVVERDVQTAGPQNLTEIGCHILDPKYRAFTVVPMADVPPPNRAVKIRVK